MIFKELSIKDAFLIELDEHSDERGSFARYFCKKEFKKAGIDFDVKQTSISKNYKKGVLRGLHYQKEPYKEIKLVSCIRGSIFDVVVDLRKDSPTYLKWISVEITEKNNKMLCIPPMCAHGFQTLEENTIILYQISEYFHPEYYDGIRWNDPKIAIQWPECEYRTINDRDNNYKLL